MLDDPNDLAILQGIISLADAFGRKVIAEGVETDVHSERLLELGCKLGQGYAIGRPMPATQIPSWCARYQGKQAVYFAKRLLDKYSATHISIPTQERGNE